MAELIYSDPWTAIHLGDARHMAEVPKASIQLVITSPPYNVGPPRDEPIPVPEYEQVLHDVFLEVLRVLTPGGVAAINVALTTSCHHKSHKHEDNYRAYPLFAKATLMLADIGFLLREPIVWSKGLGDGQAWTWATCVGSPNNPTIRSACEMIILASKEHYHRLHSTGVRGSLNLDWCKNVWFIPPAWGPTRFGTHPAPFPEELVKRLVLLFSEPGETVLDPFLGSGTTTWVSKKLGRPSIGYDTKLKWCKEAAIRCAQQIFDLPNHGTKADAGLPNCQIPIHLAF